MSPNIMWSISYFALWVITGVLYLAVFLLYRHFGRELLKQRQTLDQGGPPLDQAIDVSLTTIDGEMFRLGQESGRSHVVLFGATGCGHCDRVQPYIRELSTTTSGVGLVVVYHGDDEATRRYAEVISPSIVAVSDPGRELAKTWGVRATPFVVVTDIAGTVRQKGAAGSRAILERFFETAAKLNTVQ